MATTEWSGTMNAADRLEYTKTTSQSPSPSSHTPKSRGAKGSRANASATDGKGVEISARTGKPKRRKALRACGNCQRTHLTCDDNRPCERCIKRGCADSCADGVRKKMKYLDKNAGENQPALNDPFGTAAAHSIYSPRGGSSFGMVHRGSVPSLTNDESASSLLELSHRGRGPLIASLSRAAPSSVEHADPLMIPVTDVIDQAPSEFGVEPIAAGPRVPEMAHAGHRHLSDPTLTSHHDLAVGPVATSPLHVLPHETAVAPTYTTAAAAIIEPRQEPGAFHSYAADSEYTVVARMLESSRAKSDQDYSPADSPKFSSSNVDLRNFVTLQPPPVEPGQTPADSGYTSWLDPPPPPPPAVVVQRRKSGMPNFKRVDSDGSEQSVGTVLPHPSDIYRNVREPYPYTPAFHGLLTFLKQRFAREQLMRIVRSMARIRPSFIAVTKELTHEDLVFMEQCFQRSLLEYEKYFAYSGTPSIVWRRTGQIAAVAPEFCMLTQWPRHELRSRFIVEVMSDESAVDYFERFSDMTFTDTRGQVMYECSLLTPMGQQIRTSAVLTVRKDLFGIPMTIIGNFLPHV